MTLNPIIDTDDKGHYLDLNKTLKLDTPYEKDLLSGDLKTLKKEIRKKGRKFIFPSEYLSICSTEFPGFFWLSEKGAYFLIAKNGSPILAEADMKYSVYRDSIAWKVRKIDPAQNKIRFSKLLANRDKNYSILKKDLNQIVAAEEKKAIIASSEGIDCGC